jgi:hypothetical protein
MVSQAPTVLTKVAMPAHEAQRRSQRWPLFMSVFGAVAVSLVLWAGIFALVGWIGSAFSHLG